MPKSTGVGAEVKVDVGTGVDVGAGRVRVADGNRGGVCVAGSAIGVVDEAGVNVSGGVKVRVGKSDGEGLAGCMVLHAAKKIGSTRSNTRSRERDSIINNPMERFYHLVSISFPTVFLTLLCLPLIIPFASFLDSSMAERAAVNR
jgi:hypothetical protein